MGSDLLSYRQAASLIAGYAAQLAAQSRPVEPVDLAAALNRVLAAPLYADRDLPPFDRSARDGFACRAAEASTHQPLPVAGFTRAGQPSAAPLPLGSAWQIMTGAPVPAGADTVLMQEHVEQLPHPSAPLAAICLPESRSASPRENIAAQGSEARAGSLVLPAGTRLAAPQIALAAACGHARLSVYQRPRVAILATGDEIVPVDAQPAAHQIRNSNGPMLAALVSAAGAEPILLPAVPDNLPALAAALSLAAPADLILFSGGVSVGQFDLVEQALAAAEARFHFVGVRIQPGKPVLFGSLPASPTHGCRESGKPFLGLPGNPISAAATFHLFAAPLLAALCGSHEPSPRFALAQLSLQAEPVPGRPTLTRFLPARCSFDLASESSLPQLSTVGWQGSGDLPAFARSNCFLVVPEAVPQLTTGAIVQILLF